LEEAIWKKGKKHFFPSDSACFCACLFRNLNLHPGELRKPHFLPAFLVLPAVFLSVFSCASEEDFDFSGSFFFICIYPREKADFNPPNANLCAGDGLDKRIFSLLHIDKFD
jgi:hypothetical protein